MKAGAASDQDILAALSGIIEMQRTIRRRALDLSVDTGLVFLRIYYQRLPDFVARRLTQLDSQIVASIPRGTAGIADTTRRALSDAVANDEAFAQAIRAANLYREKLGYPLLGPDGKQEPGPEPEGGE